MVVLPAPLTPTTRTTPGVAVRAADLEPAVHGRVDERDQLLAQRGPRVLGRRRPRRGAGCAARSTTCWVGPTPRSAVSRTSSIDSQVSSSSWSRLSRASSPRPKPPCDPASRWRSRDQPGGGRPPASRSWPSAPLVLRPAASRPRSRWAVSRAGRCGCPAAAAGLRRSTRRSRRRTPTSTTATTAMIRISRRQGGHAAHPIRTGVSVRDRGGPGGGWERPPAGGPAARSVQSSSSFSEKIEMTTNATSTTSDHPEHDRCHGGSTTRRLACVRVATCSRGAAGSAATTSPTSSW